MVPPANVAVDGPRDLHGLPGADEVAGHLAAFGDDDLAPGADQVAVHLAFDLHGLTGGIEVAVDRGAGLDHRLRPVTQEFGGPCEALGQEAGRQ